MPYSKKYEVDFTSGGDTTKQAFKKHIDEFTNVYDILNALNSSKLSASDISGLSGSIGNINTSLANHINSTNPHPNWTPSISWSSLTGTKPNLADLNGNLPVSRITGDWPTSRITGNLSASRIEGLAEAITAQIPSSTGSDVDVDVNVSLLGNGYIKFGTKLILQWGSVSETGGLPSGTYQKVYNLPTAFTSKCYIFHAFRPGTNTPDNLWPFSAGTAGALATFKVSFQQSGMSGAVDEYSTRISYIAIGK